MNTEHCNCNTVYNFVTEAQIELKKSEINKEVVEKVSCCLVLLVYTSDNYIINSISGHITHLIVH